MGERIRFHYHVNKAQPAATPTMSAEEQKPWDDWVGMRIRDALETFAATAAQRQKELRDERREDGDDNVVPFLSLRGGKDAA